MLIQGVLRLLKHVDNVGAKVVKSIDNLMFNYLDEVAVRLVNFCQFSCGP